MSFSDCLNNAGLSDHLKPGLQALGGDSTKVHCRDKGKLLGSINLDEAYEAAQPNASRWDYGIGLSMGDASRAEWIEVHPANSREVRTMLAKLDWLRRTIQQWPAPCDNLESRYHWVATSSLSD